MSVQNFFPKQVKAMEVAGNCPKKFPTLQEVLIWVEILDNDTEAEISDNATIAVKI